LWRLHKQSILGKGFAMDYFGSGGGRGFEPHPDFLPKETPCKERVLVGSCFRFSI